jgi:catechol 2,3-dioxygenase-like lactoylglutathione lyase family enzyme
MATLSAIDNEAGNAPSAEWVNMKFEAVVIPVTDVDQSKAFYSKLGWRLDADFPFDNGFRVVQFTPPGSGCSVQFGTKMTTATPGSAQGLYLIVSDVEAARKELVSRGIEVSEVFHTSRAGAQFRPDSNGRISGLAPDHRSYFSFATFNDPDGNTWLFSRDHHAVARSRTQQSRRRDPHRASARDRAAPWPIRTEGSEAPLVGLVRRLHGSAPEWEDPGGGSQIRQAADRRCSVRPRAN